MKFLAIDTSGAHLTVIAVNGDKISYEFQKDCGVKHSVSLMPAVERAVKESGLNLKEADFIAAAVGAGALLLAQNAFDTDALQENVVPAVNLALLGLGTVGTYLTGRARKTL